MAEAGKSVAALVADQVVSVLETHPDLVRFLRSFVSWHDNYPASGEEDPELECLAGLDPDALNEIAAEQLQRIRNRAAQLLARAGQEVSE